MIRKQLGKMVRTVSELIEVPKYYIPYLFGGRASPPTRVDFELTYRCNLKCQFCPQELFKSKYPQSKVQTHKELETSKLCSVMDELKKGGVPLVTLTGGEPFIRKDIIEIIRHIKSIGLSLSILSNGALFTPEIANELVKVGVDTVTFSLDGPQKLHDTVRGIPNTYERITKAVGYLIEARKKAGKTRPYVNFNCTISSLNQNKFSQIIDTAVEGGVDSVSFGFLFFTNEEAVKKTASLISIQEAKEEDQILPENLRNVDTGLIDKEMELCREKAKKTGLSISFNPLLDARTLKEYFYNYDYSYTNKCFFPWKVSRVNPHGIVYPCSIDMNMGNLGEKGFFEIWNGKNYIDFRKSLKKNKLFPKCNKCCELQSKVWSVLP